jgi:hypothetical protein
MPKKYFIDTCIWRDFYEDRLSKSGRNLGKEATDLFMKIVKNKDNVLFSESLYWELGKDYDRKDIDDMLNVLSFMKVLVRVEITKEEFTEAKKLALDRNIPFVDCLNAVQARNNCAIMISQDFHFLENLKDVIKSEKPSEIS